MKQRRKSVSRYRVKTVRSGTAPLPSVQNNKQAGEFAYQELSGEPRERLIAIYIGPDGESVVGVEDIAYGDAGSVNAKIGDMLRGALVHGAWGIVLAHNHPGGGLTPSPQDMQTTARAGIMADILGMRFLDSLIVSDVDPARWTSILDHMAKQIPVAAQSVFGPLSPLVRNVPDPDSN